MKRDGESRSPPVEEETYESRTVSRMRWGCVYVLLAVFAISFISFLLLMVWERSAG
jgi:hypothetical protein